MTIINPLDREEYEFDDAESSNLANDADAEEFVNDDNAFWAEDAHVSDGEDIYFATEDINIGDYSMGLSYDLNTTVTTGTTTKVNYYVSSTTGDVPLMPSGYPESYILVTNNDTTDPDDCFNPATWETERYIGLADNLSLPLIHTQTIGNYTYTYTFIERGDDQMYVMIDCVDNGGGLGSAWSDALVPVIRKMSNLVTNADEAVCTVTSRNYFIPSVLYIENDILYMRSDDNTTGQSTSYREDVMVFSEVTGIDKQPHLSFLMKDNKFRPIDDKNYSAAQVTNPDVNLVYTLNMGKTYDTIAIRVRASETNLDCIEGSIRVRDSADANITEIPLIDIEAGTINCCVGNKIDTYFTTKVYYLPVPAPTAADGGSSIVITLLNCQELSNVMVGNKIDAGMTNLKLKNSIKDFSILEYDPFGNADYIDRARVSTYSGTVDLPITDYDRTNRMMLSMGKQVRVIDGSDDTANNGHDSYNVFAATQLIGRFMDIDLETFVENNSMTDYATYSFTFEEIV